MIWLLSLLLLGQWGVSHSSLNSWEMSRTLISHRSLLQQHPPGIGDHPPGVGHHPPGVGHHPPGVGHHPPGVGHHPPGVGHHPPGVGHHKSPLERAYVALQAWKKLIVEDPLNITGSWSDREVCNYRGVFCSWALQDPSRRVVSGIDLNHANLGGQLPEELGLLKELAIFHLNSNRFTGVLPDTLTNLGLLVELDVSNNRFSGPFPVVALQLPSLIYLDIRFNQFSGSIPPEVFSKRLDALFVNNNRFTSSLPETFGSSPVSVVVLANNMLTGEIPRSIGNMSRTLNEIVFLNNNFGGSIPSEIGFLNQVTVFDVSSNQLSSSLPNSISNMVSLEEFNVANNKLSGKLTGSVCELPRIRNLTFSNNYFVGESASCRNLSSRGVTVSTSGNCLSNHEGQKSGKECRDFYAPAPAPATPLRPPGTPAPPRPPPLQSPGTPARSPSPKPPAPVPPISPPPPLAFSPPPPAPVLFPPPPLSPLPRAPAAPPPSISPPPPVSCPPGFITGSNSGKCFLLINQQKNWSDAGAYCMEKGARLAAVANLNELLDIGELCSQAPADDALIDPFSPRGQGCYLSGRKGGDFPSSWSWAGSPCIGFNSSYWNFLEPNNLYGNENCTSIKYEPPILRASPSSPAYMLNDLACDQELPFICSPSRC